MSMEMVKNENLNANSNANENGQQVLIQRQQMQKWLAVQVIKFHRAGYDLTAEKLGCNPVREEIEREISSKVFSDPVRIRDTMYALDKNEECIQKAKNKVNKGMKKSKLKRMQVLEAAKEEAFQISELELKKDGLIQLLELEEKADGECAEKLSWLLQNANENKETARQLCAQLELLYLEIDELRSLAKETALEQKQHGLKIVELNEAIDSIQFELDQANALHCTLENGCVSESCMQVDYMYADKNLINKYLMQVLAEPYRFTDDFGEMVSIATVEEIREVARYMAITEKLSEANDGKKMIWHFEKKTNVAELLEFAGYDVVIKEEK